MKHIIHIIITAIITAIVSSVVTFLFVKQHEPQKERTLFISLDSLDFSKFFTIYPIKPIKLSDVRFDRYTIRNQAINQLDNFGRKTGLWITYNEDLKFLFMTHYLNGTKNGIERIYHKEYGTFVEEFLLNYRDGNLCSPMIVYNNNGTVGLVSTKISPVAEYSSFVPKWMKERYGLDSIYQAYSIDYDENGRIIREGWTIFPCNDWEIYEERVGEHKFYKPDGEVTTKILHASQ